MSEAVALVSMCLTQDAVTEVQGTQIIGHGERQRQPGRREAPHEVSAPSPQGHL